MENEDRKEQRRQQFNSSKKPMKKRTLEEDNISGKKINKEFKKKKLDLDEEEWEEWEQYYNR